jgi:hypothetical protein
MGYSVNRKEKVMIQYKRDRLLACAASVTAIDDWPEHANASLLGPADPDDDLASRQEEFRKKIPLTAQERKEPMALNHRPFHKSYRNKFKGSLYLSLKFCQIELFQPLRLESQPKLERHSSNLIAPDDNKVPAQVPCIQKQVV